MNNNNDKGHSDSDSIYRAPSSDTSYAPTDNLMAAYVGPKNASYYENRFEKFAAGGGALSWHWPAFLATWFWLMYRKMWLWSFIYWLGLPIAITAITMAISATGGAAVAGIFYYSSYALVMFVLAPVFANRLYYGHVKGKVAKMAATSMSAEQQSAELARIGGTSKIVFVLAPLILVALIGILAAIAIPAYQDYTIRAQVSEGLNLSDSAKAAVTVAFEDRGDFPANNTLAGLPSARQISGKYVASVEVQDGDIVITYGGDAHALLQDQVIVLEPDADEGFVQWACYSPTIANKHLPAACRS
jgi:type IV pilus assembly protein PilA